MADEPTEPCPTCDRGLWHVGHKCYTYADLDRSRYDHVLARPTEDRKPGRDA